MKSMNALLKSGTSRALVATVAFGALASVGTAQSAEAATQARRSARPAPVAPVQQQPVEATRTPAAGETQGTLFGGSGGSTADALKGLSLFASYDFNDALQSTGNADIRSERAFGLGALFEIPQFSPGLALQGGGTYEFEKQIQNSNGLKYGAWTAFGELVGYVTPQFRMTGGLNYSFPSLSGFPAEAQASVRGKMGYQIGASFQFNRHFAFDGRYRTMELDYSQTNGQGGSTTTSLRAQGLMFTGRYIF